MYKKIDKTLTLIESFKVRQISKLLEKISTKLTDAVEGNAFNSRVPSYFLGRNLEGEPYSDFEQEPDPISQIKKALNALYHARITFEDVENIDVNKLKELNLDLPEMLLQLVHKTIPHAYKASYLITHLDVDLKEIFAEELAILLPLIKQIQETVASYGGDRKALTLKLKNYPAVSHKTGWATGMVVNQLNPRDGEFDYNFLAQFSALLPKYIEKFNEQIRKFATKTTSNSKPLNHEELAELESAALSLISHLENLKSNDLFTPIKYLNYIHIVHNVVTLFMSSLHQMNNLSENSQDVIRSKLETLKYEVLPVLFSLVDKIETHAMTQANSLSKHLMAQIKPIYDFLIYYAAKVVNFDVRGEELVHIEDSRFIALRLEPTYKRIDKAKIALRKIDKVQASHTQFYSILDRLNFSGPNIELEEPLRAELTFHYKVLMAYIEEINPDANASLIQSIQACQTSLRSFFDLRESLQVLINKKRATQDFQIALNKDMVDSVHQNTQLILFPHSNPVNVFQVDESLALKSTSALQFAPYKGHNLLTNPELLNSEEAFTLHQWYQNKRAKLISAQKAYEGFMHLTQGKVQNLSPMAKIQCKNLYNQFQSYFINAVPKDRKEEALKLDKYLVHTLSKKIPDSSTAPELNYLVELHTHLSDYFAKTEQGWQAKSEAYLKLAEEKYQDEYNAIALEEYRPNPRAHYVLKHTYLSHGVKEFRESLQQVVKQMNKPMQEALAIGSEEDVPYPDLDGDDYKELAQSDQTLGIKSIYNSLYHLEQITHQLEQLNEKSFEAVYIGRLLAAYERIDKIWNLIKQLSADQHFKILVRDLVSKTQRIWFSIQELVKPYQAQWREIPSEKEVQYNTLWYVVNGFYLTPQFMRALQNNGYINPEKFHELNHQAKEATIKIERIVNSSSSYFKLFMQTPAMYGLYVELKNKIYEVTNTAYNTALNKIDQLQEKVFLPMTQEADQWEDKLGLNPGLISGPLKHIIDEFYKGLLIPLGLDSKTHLSIICDKRPLEVRQKTAYANIDTATTKLEKLEKEYEKIAVLHELLSRYEEANNALFLKDAAKIAACKAQLGAAYRAALPNLVRLQRKMGLSIKFKDRYAELDNFLNAQVKDDEPKLKSIEILIKASHQFVLGLKANETMKFRTASEKLSYLTKLAETQEQEHRTFLENYAKTAYNRELEAVCNRHIGLQYTDAEYSKRLRTKLERYSANIQAYAQTTQNIDLTTKHILHIKAAQFEQEHFADFYHLDSLRGALAQFKIYLSSATSKLQRKKSSFESEETIREKSAWIKRLNKIAEDETLSVPERMKKLKSIVAGDPNSKRIMYAHKKMEPLSFAYLLHCIAYLFEVLHFYTPKRKKIFKDMNKIVNQKPVINVLAKRFGLFSSNLPPGPRTEIKEDEQPEQRDEQNPNLQAPPLVVA
jgi:hypothetical protein